MSSVLNLSAFSETAVFSSREWEEIHSLSLESDSEMRDEGLIQLGRRMEADGHQEAAESVYSAVLEGASGDDRVSVSFRERAQGRLAALHGVGHSGLRMEVLLKDFTKTATDYRTIVPMIAGSAVYQMAKAASLSRLASASHATLLTRGLGAKLRANLTGMALEAPVFTLGSRGLLQASGEKVAWDGDAMARDFARNAVTLGVLKFFGWATAKTNNGFLLNQAGIFGGLLLADRVEAGLGLRAPVDGATTVVDTLATMFSLSAGSYLGHRLLGAPLIKLSPAREKTVFRVKEIGKAKMTHLPLPGGPMMIFSTFWGLRNLFRGGKSSDKGRTFLDPHAETAVNEIRRLPPHLQKIYYRAYHSVESALSSQPIDKLVHVKLNPRTGQRYPSDGTVSSSQLREGTVHGEFDFRNGAWFLTQESLSYLLNSLDVFRSPARRTLHLVLLQFADRQEANRILEARRDRQWGMKTPGGHRTVSVKRGTIRPKMPLPPIGKPIHSFVSWTDREARYGFGDEIEGSLIPVPPDSSFQPVGGRLWQVIHYRYTVAQGHLLALVPPDLNLHDSLPEGVPIIQVRLAQGTAAYRWEGGQKVILALTDFSDKGETQKDPAKTLLFFGQRSS